MSEIGCLGRPELKHAHVYISGPMSGIKDNNKDEFDKRKAVFNGLGYDVVSPPDMDNAEEVPLPWKDCLKRDLVEMLCCEFITMLPGWERSEGARLEKHVAEALGIVELDEQGKEVKSKTVLEEAQSLIGGDRQASYGHPSVDFARTAGMWSAYLGSPVATSDVPQMMILLKVSREKNRHKRDNIVDIAGYAGTTMMLYE